MLAAAAQAVARTVDAISAGARLPEVDDLRAVSAAIAAAVAEAAAQQGVARIDDADWDAAVRRAMWQPVYQLVVAG